MTKQSYEQLLQQAQQELASAVQQRDHWNLEIVRLQNLVNTLAFVSTANAQQVEQHNAEWQVYTQLVQAIEALVNTSVDAVTPIEIRDSLLSYGYNIGHYSNPMAMIHQTLKRLATDKRIRVLPDGRYARTVIYDALLKAAK
ncbi:MAG: hypothetical protein ACLQVM_26550 [Terriglobia bacterium]